MKKIKLLSLNIVALLFAEAKASSTCQIVEETMSKEEVVTTVGVMNSITESSNISQTIIAGATGKVNSLEIEVTSIHSEFDSSYFVVYIYDLVNNTTIEYGRKLIGIFPNERVTVKFDFSKPAQFVSGNQYNIILGTLYNRENHIAVLGTSGFDSYSDGAFGVHNNANGFTPSANSEDMYLKLCYTELGNEVPVNPKTRLTLEDCGKTISSPSETISAFPVFGAEKYRFTFAASGQTTVIKQTNDPVYNYSVDIDRFAPGVTYSAMVEVKTNAGWGPDGQACNVTTYSTPATQLVSLDCDKVMETRTETLTAEAVSGADRYRFTFTASDQPTIVREQSGTVYNYPFFAKNFLPGTQYTVSVQARVSGVWGASNPICTFTTPGGGEGEVQECGANFVSWNQNINASQQSGAQKYSFIFNVSGQPQVSYTTTKPYVKLSRVNGLVGSTEYSVRLRVLKNNIFGPAGSLESCLITTPSGSPTREAVFADGAEEIFMYPNPVDGNRVYFSGQINNVEVIDMLGNTVTTEPQAESLDVTELSAGMYMIKSDEGVVRMMVK